MMKGTVRIVLMVLWLEARRILSGRKYFAEIDVTDNCNLRCKHCYHFHGKTKFKKDETPINVWNDRFKELHNSGVRFVLLLGGEPALRTDVLMLAHEIFPYMCVITNGTLKIPGKFTHPLFVSLDGLEKTNDAIRGKGVFSRVLRTYSGDDRVIINMTLTEKNHKELEDVVKLAKKNNFRGVVCNVCAGGTDVKIPMSISRDERVSIIKEMNRVQSLYPNDLLLSKAMIKWYENPDHRDHCYWGDDVLHFDVNWKKRRCFASNADCANCGCLAGSFQNPVKMIMHPREAFRIIMV